jgi:hypothetical protein
VQWLWIVGALVWLAIAWTAAGAVRGGIARDAALGTGVAAVGALAVVITVMSLGATAPNVDNDARSFTAFAPSARAALRSLPGPVLIDNGAGIYSYGAAEGLFALGIDDGIAVRDRPEALHIVGRKYTTTPERAATEVVVTADSDDKPYLDNPQYRIIALYDPLTTAEQAERRALHADLVRAEHGTVAGGLRWKAAHPDAWTRLRALERRGLRLVLFERIPSTRTNPASCRGGNVSPASTRASSCEVPASGSNNSR